MAEIRFENGELDELVKQIIEGVLKNFENQRQLLNGRLAIREGEAAELLGLNPWQLRDLRLSGQIAFRRIVGNRVRYAPEDLARYLDQHLERGR